MAQQPQPSPVPWRLRMERLYRVYCPHRLPMLDAALEKYRGKETALLAAMVSKYGPEPPEDVAMAFFSAEEQSEMRALEAAEAEAAVASAAEGAAAAVDDATGALPLALPPSPAEEPTRVAANDRQARRVAVGGPRHEEQQQQQQLPQGQPQLVGLSLPPPAPRILLAAAGTTEDSRDLAPLPRPAGGFFIPRRRSSSGLLEDMAVLPAAAQRAVPSSSQLSSPSPDAPQVTSPLRPPRGVATIAEEDDSSSGNDGGGGDGMHLVLRHSTSSSTAAAAAAAAAPANNKASALQRSGSGGLLLPTNNNNNGGALLRMAAEGCGAIPPVVVALPLGRPPPSAIIGLGTPSVPAGGRTGGGEGGEAVDTPTTTTTGDAGRSSAPSPPPPPRGIHHGHIASDHGLLAAAVAAAATRRPGGGGYPTATTTTMSPQPALSAAVVTVRLLSAVDLGFDSHRGPNFESRVTSHTPSRWD